ncbi:MAG: hypothetical protein DRP65_07460 [Planctomycetota bacterium]|nr:MAG: hypothetical protein DRP65_07460 [Planctomycetota bacterium]
MFISLMVVKILLSSYNTLLIRPKNLYNANGSIRVAVPNDPLYCDVRRIVNVHNLFGRRVGRTG